MPSFTIISNAMAIVKSSAKPVLVDVNLNTWNIKIEDIEKRITKKTKCLMIPHIYGLSNDMDEIMKIAKKYNLYVIEDAAEVLGLKYKNKPCGSFGDISVLSFYANKHVTTGEGGMISTSNPKYFSKCRDLRNLCFGKKDKFIHTDIGWNYRITNIQAALGISQLKNIKKIINRKVQIGKLYHKLLSKNKNIFIQKPYKGKFKNIYWVVGLLILNKKISADKIAKKLQKIGIQTRPFFYPMNKQKILAKYISQKKDKFPNSEYISKYGFYLPSSLSMSADEIKFISKCVNQIIK